jgi:hypothetical protein
MALDMYQALDMINRSAITGVPTSEFDAAGGYDAVYQLAKQAGWDGTPSKEAVAMYGGKVADTGVGNWAYSPPPTRQSVDDMVNNGIGLNSIYNIVNGFQNGNLGSNYANATQYPFSQQPYQPISQQQAPASYVNNAFPQYTPNYANLTQASYTPQQTNALMRPITPNSSLTQQQQYQNIGYNTNRSSLWGDW